MYMCLRIYIIYNVGLSEPWDMSEVCSHIEQTERASFEAHILGEEHEVVYL